MEEKYVNPINYKKLCENIKSLMRDRDNMKQAALGDVIGIPQGEVSKVLRGKRRFQLDEVVRIADYFDVSIDSLLDRDHPRQQEDISAREICEMLLKLRKKGAKFKNIQWKETCYEYDPHEEDVCHSIRENTYPAFFFPEFMQPKDEEEAHMYSQIENRDSFNSCINDFIKKVSAIRIAQNNGIFDETTANEFINKCLEELPG